MKKPKKKLKYLSYIEETRKHYGILKTVAATATKRAVTITKSHKLPLTYKEGMKIIREHSNGKKEVIGLVKESSVKVTKGATITLY